jgi:glucose-6-phosphate 1-epimerase
MTPLRLEGAGGVALIHPIGATVLSWAPAGRGDVLWCSPAARFEPGRAIRGGVPICWPWFASAGQPAHGLLRQQVWSLERQGEVDGDAFAEWSITHDDPAQAPPFEAHFTVRVGRELVLRLRHEDRSGAPSTVGGALHAYFAADAARASVTGLRGPAFDKRSGGWVDVGGPVGFADPIDWVVPGAASPVLDDGRGGGVVIDGRGHSDVVLWNPGPDGASDVPPGGERDFVCVEVGVVSAPIRLAPGGVAQLGARLRPCNRAEPLVHGR